MFRNSSIYFLSLYDWLLSGGGRKSFVFIVQIFLAPFGLYCGRGLVLRCILSLYYRPFYSYYLFHKWIEIEEVLISFSLFGSLLFGLRGMSEIIGCLTIKKALFFSYQIKLIKSYSLWQLKAKKTAFVFSEHLWWVSPLSCLGIGQFTLCTS